MPRTDVTDMLANVFIAVLTYLRNQVKEEARKRAEDTVTLFQSQVDKRYSDTDCRKITD